MSVRTSREIVHSADRGPGGMQLTENFGFLADHDAELVKLGALAERYFRDDPPTALFKLRQFAELLSKLIAAHHALYVGERETFEDTLRRLSYFPAQN
jgi:type I restriction enzyme, R subunit